MRKLTLIILTMFLLCAVNSFAAIPKLINYQGRLTDSQGQPITGTKSVTFRIYDVASGGSPLWQETHTATFDRGIFNVMIGGVTPLDLSFDRQYYLGIQVGSDAEMSPRQSLASSAYALRANVADEAVQAQTANKAITIESRTSDPSSPATGQMWLRTDL